MNIDAVSTGKYLQVVVTSDFTKYLMIVCWWRYYYNSVIQSRGM